MSSERTRFLTMATSLTLWQASARTARAGQADVQIACVSNHHATEEVFPIGSEDVYEAVGPVYKAKWNITHTSCTSTKRDRGTSGT